METSGSDPDPVQSLARELRDIASYLRMRIANTRSWATLACLFLATFCLFHFGKFLLLVFFKTLIKIPAKH